MNLSKPSASRPATIKDVANAVGLSIATVSRALSNPEMLSAATLERVCAALYEPPLSTVRIPTFEIGYLSMSKLIRMLAGETTEHSTVLPSQLVLRHSTLTTFARDP